MNEKVLYPYSNTELNSGF